MMVEPIKLDTTKGIASLKRDHAACEDPAPRFEVRTMIGPFDCIYGPFTEVTKAEECAIALAGRSDSGINTVWGAEIILVVNKEDDK